MDWETDKITDLALEMGYIEKKDGKVFASYVSEDEWFVSQVCTKLANFGIQVWVDKLNLNFGSNWKDDIRTAVKEGHAFIAFFSDSYFSKDSSYMNEELNLALEQLRLRRFGEKWFYPILLGGEIPDIQVSQSLNIRDIQWLDARQAGIELVADSIAKSIYPEAFEAHGDLSKYIYAYYPEKTVNYELDSPIGRMVEAEKSIQRARKIESLESQWANVPEWEKEFFKIFLDRKRGMVWPESSYTVPTIGQIIEATLNKFSENGDPKAFVSSISYDDRSLIFEKNWSVKTGYHGDYDDWYLDISDFTREIILAFLYEKLNLPN